MFIQTEETPNPLALKFIPDGNLIAPNGNLTFKSQQQAAKISPLAMQLFEIAGIELIFFGSDFITITKKSEANWNALKPEIQACLIDFFISKKPVLFANNVDSSQQNQHSNQNQSNLNQVDPNQINENDSEIVKQIKELIEIKVRPAVAMDGGDIVFHSFEDGIVKLSLKGSCSGCPSSTITLKNGIENMLRHYIPEVEAVEKVEDEDEF